MLISELFTILNILDITGFIFGASGSLCVGLKNKYGFIFFILGSTAHGLLGFIQGNYGLLATCLFFIVADIYFFLKWAHEDAYKNEYLHALDQKNASQKETIYSNLKGKGE